MKEAGRHNSRGRVSRSRSNYDERKTRVFVEFTQRNQTKTWHKDDGITVLLPHAEQNEVRHDCLNYWNERSGNISEREKGNSKTRVWEVLVSKRVAFAVKTKTWCADEKHWQRARKKIRENQIFVIVY